MGKRIVTATFLFATVFAAVALAYFVHPVFLDLYMMLWTVTAVVEMCRCFKSSGYNIHKAPLIIAMLISFPVYYLMERYLNQGFLGSLLVLMAAIFTLMITFTVGNQEKNTMTRCL